MRPAFSNEIDMVNRKFPDTRPVYFIFFPEEEMNQLCSIQSRLELPIRSSLFCFGQDQVFQNGEDHKGVRDELDRAIGTCSGTI